METLEINKIHCGDCIETLKQIESNSVDSIVTDPPYELGFMGKKWDSTGIANNVEMWQECLRVLKPGGHLLAFSGTRTYHRMASAIEDAGFEIRDMVEWVYGSGFPKSLNIGKAVDKIIERKDLFEPFAKHFSEQVEKSGKSQKEIASLFPSKTGGLTGCVWNCTNGANVPTVAQWNILKPLLDLSDDFLPLIERIEREREVIGKTITNKTVYQNIGGTNISGEIEITKGASEWEGWGTALKPAHEPICMARKPLAEKTVAENVLKWGTGGINIDESRVTYGEETDSRIGTDARAGGSKESMYGGYSNVKDKDIKMYKNNGRFPANLIHDNSEEVRECFPNESERFFKSIIYQAKASKSERGNLNNHPTVKPIALMEYLITMVTPKGGIVLDPFAGSGTTGIACKNLNRNFILIEKEQEYCKIAEARINNGNK